MLRNYLKSTVRSIRRRKLFSFINITGLAFGIAFILLIGQFLYYELSCNAGLKDINNIYRLVDAGRKDYNIDYRIRDQILESVPGVKNACVFNHGSADANVNNKIFDIKDILITDPNFFNDFNIQIIYGSPRDALNNIDDIVLTESAAIKIFGKSDVVGKTILMNHRNNMVVTGVVKDLPKNINFKGEVFVSYLNSPGQRLSYKMDCSSYDGKDDSKCKYPFNIFVELNKHADVNKIAKQISALNNIDGYRYPKKVILTPLKTNYLDLEYPDYDLMHGNDGLIRLLSAIGIIILLLAVINFINLETAAYKHRFKEIGIKKCLGAGRKNLIYQLLTESSFTCIISAVFGIIIAELFLPYFNEYVDKPLAFQIFSNPVFVELFIGFIALLSILTGLFPAIILSKISPLHLFKSNPYLKGTGKRYRGFLTTFQFAITIILISGLIVIFEQIDFVKHKYLGFNTDKLLYIKVNYTMGNRVNAFADKLLQYHGTKSLTKTMGVPGDIRMSMGGSIGSFETMVIDSSSLKTFGFKIIEGRNLLPSDADKACLINTEALKKFDNGKFRDQKINGSKIVGVVADFNYSSLYNSTGPLVLMYSPQWGITHITMRISGPAGKAIGYIKNEWRKIFPDYKIEFGFYNDYFASMYKKEENLATLISIFSILAVVISCLGIFGLSVFESEQRIKEIGIRKVLGASVAEIILILTKGFSKWIIIANVIAIPVAYYFAAKWLQSFAYKITPGWRTFAIAGGTAVMIALATISIQTIKAATANPVKSLRYE